MRKLLKLITQFVLMVGCLFTVSNFAIAKGGHGGGGGHHGGGHHGGHHGGGHHGGHHGGVHHGGHHGEGHHGGHHHGHHGGGWWWGIGVGVPVGYYAATYYNEPNTVVVEQPVEEVNILISINPSFANANPDWANSMAANIDAVDGAKYMQMIQGQDFAANPTMDLYMLWPKYNDMRVAYKVYISHGGDERMLIGSTQGDTMYIPASVLKSGSPNTLWVEAVDGSGQVVGGSPRINL